MALTYGSADLKHAHPPMKTKDFEAQTLTTDLGNSRRQAPPTRHLEFHYRLLFHRDWQRLDIIAVVRCQLHERCRLQTNSSRCNNLVGERANRPGLHVRTYVGPQSSTSKSSSALPFAYPSVEAVTMATFPRRGFQAAADITGNSEFQPLQSHLTDPSTRHSA